MLYTDVVNATLLSADPTVPETIRRQAVVFLDEFLNSPESFKISVDIFGRGRDEFSSITRMFCLTVIEHCIEQRFNTLDPSECDSFRDKMWIWYTDSIRDELFIRNKLIKVLVVLFGKRYYNNSQEFFNHLIAVLRMQSATPEDYYSKVEMFLKACKTLNEEIIAPSSLDPNREFQERSNEIKDSVREGVLVALTSEWISIMNDCYQRGIHKLVKLCLDTFSEYIPWMPIEFSTSSEFVQSMYQYAEIEDLSASAVDCITQIVLKKMPPIDKLILIQSLDMTLILDKLVQMSSALDSDMKTAHLINVLGTAFCDGCKSEKSTSQEKEECMKRLEWLNVYARKIVLDNAEDEVVSALYPYLHSYLTIIGEIRRRFSTAAQADVYLSQVASILHTVILAMKYSEHYPYSESDAHEEDFPFTKKRAVSDYLYFVRLAFNVFQTLKKLFNTIGGIVPDLQISYVFQLVEQTLKPPTMLELPWADIELALLLISLVRDTVKKSGKCMSSASHVTLT